MQATDRNALQGSLLLVRGTAMELGYGPKQTVCTARTQSVQDAPKALKKWGKYKGSAGIRETGHLPGVEGSCG